MVEANEENKVGGQPQDHMTNGLDEDISMMMDALDKKYSVGLIQARLQALKKFK